MEAGREKILVRGVNWLGDAVMTTPALLRLREARPNAQITLLTPEKIAGLWKNHPAIDDTIIFTPKETFQQVAKRLRWGNFDIGLIFPNSPRSALEMWLGKVRHRIGYRRQWRNFFLSEAVVERPDKVKMRKRSPTEINRLIAESVTPTEIIPNSAHQIHDYLHLVRALGANPKPVAPFIYVGDDEVVQVRERLALDPQIPLFGLNPGAEYGPAKRWPRERFIEAAIKIQDEIDCHWVVFGGNADFEIAADIATKIRAAGVHRGKISVLNLAGKTTLRELCAVLKLCRVLLTNDTGPAHVAAAVGTPVVIPFGSTSPELTGPGLPGDSRHHFLQANVPCAPCFLRQCPIDFRCMTGIEISRVVDVVLKSASGPKIS